MKQTVLTKILTATLITEMTILSFLGCSAKPDNTEEKITIDDLCDHYELLLERSDNKDPLVNSTDLALDMDIKDFNEQQEYDWKKITRDDLNIKCDFYQERLDEEIDDAIKKFKERDIYTPYTYGLYKINGWCSTLEFFDLYEGGEEQRYQSATHTGQGFDIKDALVPGCVFYEMIKTPCTIDHISGPEEWTTEKACCLENCSRSHES